MTTFDSYSAYYDLLYRDKDYSAEASYVLGLVRRVVPNPQTVLELGCGTGQHAALLAEQGLSVTGVDMSASMLNGAEERRAGLRTDLQSRITLRHGDIRTLRLEQRFDAVISLFHVISYQTGNDDLLRTFTTAREHMTPNGCFVFDFWYGPAVLSQRPETRILDLDSQSVHVTRFATPELRANENVVNVNYAILVEDKVNRSVGRINECHAMRFLFLPEINNMLLQCQLRMVEARGWMLNTAPDCSTWAAVVTAKAG